MGKDKNKVPQGSITAEDIESFLDSNADFSFENRIVKVLLDFGAEVKHAGTYTDAITKKIRQYDVRAQIRVDSSRIGHIAVECKNLSPSRPLIIHCVRRKWEESFDDFFFVPREVPEIFGGGVVEHLLPKVFSVRRRGVHSLYQRGKFVGKAMDQVNKNQDGTFSGKDSEIFERMTQCVSSAEAFVDEISVKKPERDIVVHVVVPILVFPEDTLWVVKYDGGVIEGSAEKVKHVQYYLDRDTTSEFRGEEGHPVLSHMELVTPSGLKDLLVEYFGNEDQNDLGFPKAFGPPKVLRKHIDEALVFGEKK